MSGPAINLSFLSLTERQKRVVATGNDVNVRLQYNQLPAEFGQKIFTVLSFLNLFYTQSLLERLKFPFSPVFNEQTVTFGTGLHVLELQ